MLVEIEVEKSLTLYGVSTIKTAVSFNSHLKCFSQANSLYSFWLAFVGTHYLVPISLCSR